MYACLQEDEMGKRFLADASTCFAEAKINPEPELAWYVTPQLSQNQHVMLTIMNDTLGMHVERR
jgi:hypothetical protein